MENMNEIYQILSKDVLDTWFKTEHISFQHMLRQCMAIVKGMERKIILQGPHPNEKTDQNLRDIIITMFNQYHQYFIHELYVEGIMFDMDWIRDFQKQCEERLDIWMALIQKHVGPIKTTQELQQEAILILNLWKTLSNLLSNGHP